MTVEVKRETLVHLRRLVIGQTVLIVALLAAVWWTSWHGRSDVVGTQRSECLARASSAAIGADAWQSLARFADSQSTAWLAAAEARRTDGHPRTADVYEGTAAAATATAGHGWTYVTRLRKRADGALCESMFPDPGPFAFT